MSDLTTKQMEQADEFEAQTIEYLQTITGKAFDIENDEDHAIIREFMDAVCVTLEEAGVITEMELWPFIVLEE